MPNRLKIKRLFSEPITFMVSEEDFQSLYDKAKVENVSISVYIRRHLGCKHVVYTKT